MSLTVKICGITRPEDAEAAIFAGADAVGFNFCEKSPRYLQPDRAAAIETLNALRVGVFVNASPAEVAAVARAARLDIVQLHGDEDPQDFAPLRVWKAHRVSPGWTLPFEPGTEAIVLDGPAPGTGTTFDWSVAAQVHVRFLLAGGLDAENVAEAIRMAKPWGVDACSRLESAPGVKDHEKVARFIRAARTAIL
jgi:phosphoribosylanthranilate isomerase